MIKIIVDSTCDLSDEFIKKNNIDVISLQIFVNDQSYRDIKEIKIEQLYEAIESNKDVKTSLPNLTDMDDLFSKYAKEGTEFVFFTFSKEMSGTYNAATMIINQLKETYDTNMAVIDTKNGGIANALIIKRFVENKKDFNSFEEKVDYARSLADEIKHIFIVNDLTQLKKGGRIGLLKALVGSILHIKPILFIDNGTINVYKNAIGERRAINEMIRFVERHVDDKDKLIGLNFTKEKAIYESTKKSLSQKGYHNFIEQRLASTMTAHIGLDAVSISFFTNK